MKNYKFSIITVTLNSEKFLERCLNSVKNLNHKNFEHVIIDGGSTDSTKKILKNNETNFTKMIFEKDSGRVIGGAIIGTNAGEMLGEIGLAIEMGADAEDLALTIHAHPTLNESIGLAAEVFEGSITDMPNPKAVKKK